MNEQKQPQPRNDTAFLIVTAALVLMIIALLAGLWVKATWRAMAAENQLARRDNEIAQIRTFLQANPLLPAVNRDDLPTRQVTLDGKRVRALRLPADLARQIGLKPGDVVLVDRPPATAPSTRQTPPTQPATE